MCGEKGAWTQITSGSTGSPPHMRGKEKREVDENQPCGITPAHAGKRTGSLTAPQQIGDHPRTCGEKGCRSGQSLHVGGSPPHMRGKDAMMIASASPIGITPAHAGKSCPFLRRTSPRRDHPRTCGEKHCACRGSAGAVGSPPHMRGKVCFMLFSRPSTRITPAHAGKRKQPLKKLS